MDHNQVRSEDFVERYVAGRLSPADEAEFEEHYFGCGECFREVQLTERIVAGLETRQKDEPETRTAEGLGWLRRFIDFLSGGSTMPVLAATATVLVMFLAYPAWRGAVMMPELQDAVSRLEQPRANIQSVQLRQERAGESFAATVVEVSEASDVFVLSFNLLSKRAAESSLQAEIKDAIGTTVWEADNLTGSGPYEVYSVLCSAMFFDSGDYTLSVFELDSMQNQLVNETVFPFEVVKTSNLE